MSSDPSAPSKHNAYLVRRQRMSRIWDLWTRGCTNKSQIAAALGIATSTVTVDMRCIEREWIRQTSVSAIKKRARRVQQLEAIAYEARNGFDRSRQDATEYNAVKKTCDRCQGLKSLITENADGEDEHVECPSCSGAGTVTVETVKTKGQAGDPSFLRIAQACVAEAAKLECLYPQHSDPGNSEVHRTLIQNVHNEINIADGGENPLLKAPPEIILAAKAALDAVREAARDAAEEEQNRKLIEVRATRKESNDNE